VMEFEDRVLRMTFGSHGVHNNGIKTHTTSICVISLDNVAVF
jgi:hypothetical protein